MATVQTTVMAVLCPVIAHFKYTLMNLNSMQLYAQMQDEISQLKLCCRNEIIMIEGCFNIALLYWNKIKTCSLYTLFKSETEEINFFKHIKPLFIAVIEYYTLCYQAILFKPHNDEDELALYWINQLQRAQLFYNRHKEFYQYYISGETNRDKIYFMQPGSVNTLHDSLPGDLAIKNSHDHIAARILGYQQYCSYVEAELEIMMKENIGRWNMQKKMIRAF